MTVTETNMRIYINITRPRLTSDEWLARDNDKYFKEMLKQKDPIVMGSKHKPEKWRPRRHR